MPCRLLPLPQQLGDVVSFAAPVSSLLLFSSSINLLTHLFSCSLMSEEMGTLTATPSACLKVSQLPIARTVNSVLSLALLQP